MWYLSHIWLLHYLKHYVLLSPRPIVYIRAQFFAFAQFLSVLPNVIKLYSIIQNTSTVLKIWGAVFSCQSLSAWSHIKVTSPLYQHGWDVSNQRSCYYPVGTPDLLSFCWLTGGPSGLALKRLWVPHWLKLSSSSEWLKEASKILRIQHVWTPQEVFL